MCIIGTGMIFNKNNLVNVYLTGAALSGLNGQIQHYILSNGGLREYKRIYYLNYCYIANKMCYFMLLRFLLKILFCLLVF